jgi:hypothetical protein
MVKANEENIGGRNILGHWNVLGTLAFQLGNVDVTQYSVGRRNSLRHSTNTKDLSLD